MKFFIKEKFRERKRKSKNVFSDDESEEQKIFYDFFIYSPGILIAIIAHR
jgi:hypothetical protein